MASKLGLKLEIEAESLNKTLKEMILVTFPFHHLTSNLEFEAFLRPFWGHQISVHIDNDREEDKIESQTKMITSLEDQIGKMTPTQTTTTTTTNSETKKPSCYEGLKSAN